MNNDLDIQEVYLSLAPGKWYTSADVSAILQMPVRKVERALIDLRDRGIVEVDDQGHVYYRRLIKSHIRQDGERIPCQSGARQRREQKREQQVGECAVDET